jgi:hypothetical protein
MARCVSLTDWTVRPVLLQRSEQQSGVELSQLRQIEVPLAAVLVVRPAGPSSALLWL